MLQSETSDTGGVERSLPAAPVVSLPADRPFLGVYDSETRAFDDANMDVEQAFISWEETDDLAAFLAACRERRRVPLVTIEPWTTASNVTANVLIETITGRNDALIRANARAIRRVAPQQVLVRFAHEMDLVGKYPWAVAEPRRSIAAYRHYFQIFRAEGVDNVAWLWSPAGDVDATAYYPGDDCVDFVGVTILEYRARNVRTGSAWAPSFDACFAPMYERMMRFGKPIVVAELGVAVGAPGHQPAWLIDALQCFDAYPLLRGVVYFHSDNAPNAQTADRPDFRLTNAGVDRGIPVLPFQIEPHANGWERGAERIERHRAGRRRSIRQGERQASQDEDGPPSSHTMQ